ncbi:MAG: translation initiation factor IF-6 [Thermoplasmata archaeon]
MITKLDFSGNPYIGVYCSANEGYVLCNPSIPAKVVRKAAESLGVEAVLTTIGGSTILGSLVRSNSYGSIVTNFATEKEMSELKKLKPAEINHKLNAVGNNILCNDNGALVHPGFGRNAVNLLEDTFQVPVVKGTIAGLKTVGSVAVATNKGVVCHPKIADEEKKLLEEVLRVPATIATANYGTTYLGACLVANSKGAVVGTTTTPIEIGRIEDGLVLY